MNVKVIENLTINRWEEYKNIKISSIENEKLAFSESLEKLKSKTDEEWKKELKDLDHDKGVLIFLEDENNKLIGFAGAHVHSNPRLAHNAFLSNLYVYPEYRGQGFGTQLINERIRVLKNRYPEVSNLHCEIVTTQTSSIEIHKKIGFTISGEIKNLFKIEGVFYGEYWLQKNI
jgi:phosphinothricin acetyltransferase